MTQLCKMFCPDGLQSVGSIQETENDEQVGVPGEAEEAIDQ